MTISGTKLSVGKTSGSYERKTEVSDMLNSNAR